ncbi:MAG: DUF559 domain-containing protein [Alphaproteobacteria bacterium]
MKKEKAPALQIARARHLRRDDPMAERILWNALRKQCDATGLKFRRQHPIAHYIADFACVRHRLVIEIDGWPHDSRVAYDAKRDIVLTALGWRVVRFSDVDVKGNLEGIVETILKMTQAPSPAKTKGLHKNVSPSFRFLSPRGEGHQAFTTSSYYLE